MAGMYATRLSHAHLKVRNLERSVTFYTRFLDLQLAERWAHTALLVSSSSPYPYELALEEAAAPTTGVRLGFILEGREAFQEAYRFLKLEGAPFRAEDRGFTWVLVLEDPDGNWVELVWDRRAAGGAAFWRGQVRPLAEAEVLEGA